MGVIYICHLLLKKTCYAKVCFERMQKRYCKTSIKYKSTFLESALSTRLKLNSVNEILLNNSNTTHTLCTNSVYKVKSPLRHGSLNTDCLFRLNYRLLHSSSLNCDEEKEKHKENYKSKGVEDDDENEEQKKASLEKLLKINTTLWGISLVFSFFAMLAAVYLMFKDQEETIERFISWKTFVNTMLSVGEVEKLIVRPDINLVTIVLYDGAIIPGQYTYSKIYHMHVNVYQFEQDLRKVEAMLGIEEGKGVPIIYERADFISKSPQITDSELK